MSEFTPIRKTVTRQNLEAAFGGESMANRKYLYFAKIARQLGDEEVAALFEETAHQETAHALSHLELLYPPETLSVERLLQMAIEGETHEYTTMYPEFRATAVAEQDDAAVAEFLRGFADRSGFADAPDWLLDIPPVELSSTDLRTAIARGERPDGISDGVWREITARGLYGFGGGR